MILKDVLRKIVRSQREQILSWEYGIKREKLAEIDLKLPHATIISGIRRCGKSTLLRQLIKNKKFYYFNFEDPRSKNFEVSDFEKLNQVFEEEYGKNGHYFFDEIQNVEEWERFVRGLLDQKKKCIITGSNASLLSRELGTKLTGRHITYELFPFSYSEMIKLTKQNQGLHSFRDYLKNGGFPEYLIFKNQNVLQELLSDILARDIIIRNKIRETKIVEDMIVYLFSNISKEFSYNSLKKVFQLGSVNSAISYVSFFEQSYLLFTVSKFDYSLKKQLVNPKKAYAIDTGFASANSVSLSEDKGRMLENVVFLNLRKNHKSIFYYKDNFECDFIIKEGRKITKAYQVCHSLDEDNKHREINGLLEALDKFDLNKGYILTHNQEDELKVRRKKIIVRPVWKWLINQKNILNKNSSLPS